LKFKHVIPVTWRLRLRVAHRCWHDWRSGQTRQMAVRHVQPSDGAAFQVQITLTQPLGSATGLQLENKKHNLRTAVSRLNQVLILPGEVFSFWRHVGEPSAKAGYLHGRTITGDALATSIGGGLCQISGMLYLLALQAGLKIAERHPHSKDIYTDLTRFAPLGADATVVYGYKDLRVMNNSSAALCLRLTVNDADIQVMLCSTQKLIPGRLEFNAHPLPGATRVETFRFGHGEILGEHISSDVYPKLT
jgi:vancomycin resistance protein VanW